MKLNKKLSVALVVSMVALSAVGCGSKDSNGKGMDPTESEIKNMPKMSEQEIQKGLEDGAIIREK
ncbi:Uncharacterised protein [[Clostridium] sordellii]|uniref:hypothetical protein n=1 Tax=Paraclostridium sordellii TaxID=1505 RepID=UPI0005E91C1D|nr:hypothetical protein [Paeniclostridium sordellii]CEQ22045.1 Uncharacterised protein [[Clostridium] sordellii] [Paeniclostridium sordellii]